MYTYNMYYYECMLYVYIAIYLATLGIHIACTYNVPIVYI